MKKIVVIFFISKIRLLFQGLFFIFRVGFDEAKTHMYTIRCKFVVILGSWELKLMLK